MNRKDRDKESSDTNNFDTKDSGEMPDLSNGDVQNASLTSATGPNNNPTEKAGVNRLQIGPYKVLQKIAEGGMGAVYMAEQEHPIRRRIALKIIKAGQDSEQIVTRFEAERQALAMMNHPNIAKVLDVGKTEDGSPYFAMELVKGIAFTEYCDQNKLSIQERLMLFIPVCNAVQHAHLKGVIHRDLKPSNVLVALYDGVPVPKVIDFGLAKATEHQIRLTDKTMFTEYGQIVGTLQYMSPEQAEMNQLDVDTRTDIYSLGVMLYEILTGTTPLDSETMEQHALLKVLELIREKEPPRPSTRLSQSTEATTGVSAQRKIQPAKLRHILKGELDWIVMKSLAKDRTRRYETASGFAQDISRYLNDEAVMARPPSTGYRIRKFISKNRGLVASLMTIALVLFAGIAGTSIGLFRAIEQKNVADDKTREAKRERESARDSESKAIRAKSTAVAARKRAEEQKKIAEIERKRARDSEAVARDSDAASKFQLANARWDASRAAEARDLLHQIPVEYRNNFEWHFFNRQFLGSDMTLYGHRRWAQSVAFSPDGTTIASGSQDHTIKVWNAKTGEEIRTLKGPDGHIDGVVSVDFNFDGTKIASGSRDNTVKVWDVAAKKVVSTLKEHTGEVLSVAFSPNGAWIASASKDKTVKLWEPKTGKIMTLLGHTSEVLSLAFSPDGARIASASHDRSIKIWNAETGEELDTFPKQIWDIRCVAFSPDGRKIVSGSRGNSITVWDSETGTEIATLIGHTSTVHSVAFSPDGARIISGSSDNTIKIWNARTGMKISTLNGHAGWVTSVAYSPDGARIVSSSFDATVKVWDAKTGQAIPTLLGHTDWVTSVAFSPDGKRIASGSQDKTVKLWEVKAEAEINTQIGKAVASLAFSPDGERIVSGSPDQAIIVWDTESDAVTLLNGHTNQVQSVDWNTDGTTIAAGSWDQTVTVWDPIEGQKISTFDKHDASILSVAFSPDGANIASGSGDKTIKLWDARTANTIHTFNGHWDAVTCLAFSPDGEKMVSGSRDQAIKVWNVKTGKEVSTLVGHTGWVSSVVFSPDGTRIASGSRDKSIKLWNAKTGREIATLQGHHYDVRSVAFSADGGSIVSGSEDKTIKIWEAKTEQEISILKGHTDMVHSVSFSPDGARIASGGLDNTIKIWDVKTGKVIRNLRGHSDPVSRVAFSSDGTRIYSNSFSSEYMVWDVEQEKHLKDVQWIGMKNYQQHPTDDRWLVTIDGPNVVLVDLEFKNTPREMAYRENKARLDPFWHHQQAVAAQSTEDWFAASFHFAWAIKASSQNGEYIEGFRNAVSKLKNEYQGRGASLDQILPETVREALAVVENE